VILSVLNTQLSGTISELRTDQQNLILRRRHPEEEVQKTGRSCLVSELGRTP
jgi:hypothetical protein